MGGMQEGEETLEWGVYIRGELKWYKKQQESK